MAKKQNTLQHPVKPLYPEVITKNGFVGTWDNTAKKFIPAGKVIHLKGIHQSIETGQVTWELAFDYLGEEKTVNLSRLDVTRNKIIQLAEYGADVFDHNASLILKHLRNEEAKAPATKIHTRIGWWTIDDNLVYFANKSVCFDSDYVGQLAIAPRGSYKTWLAIIKELLGTVPLEAMLVFGLSAIVVGMIARDVGIDTQIVHAYGESSAGKTTATMLAISPFGYPALKEDGLFGSWNTTKNAGVASLRENNGMAVARDELSMTDQTDISSTIYSLSSGKDKVRMQKDQTIRQTASWNTTIISNGEHSMKVKSNQNTGLKVRKSEYGNVKWTESAEQADAIREGVLQNYGHAAPIMAKHMMKIGKEAVIDSWREWKNIILEQMPNPDPFSDRIAAKIAIMMSTAEIASKALALPFQIDKILAFILNYEHEAKANRDLFTNAYEYFIEQVNINHHRFGRKCDLGNSSDSDSPLYEEWGWIDTKVLSRGKSEKTIVVYQSKFREILNQGNFQDPDVILKEWKKRGILDAEKDRLTRSRKTAQGTVNMFVVRVLNRLPKDGTKVNLKVVDINDM